MHESVTEPLARPRRVRKGWLLLAEGGGQYGQQRNANYEGKDSDDYHWYQHRHFYLIQLHLLLNQSVGSEDPSEDHSTEQSSQDSHQHKDYCPRNKNHQCSLTRSGSMHISYSHH